jgi:hypothetical protein
MCRRVQKIFTPTCKLIIKYVLGCTICFGDWTPSRLCASAQYLLINLKLYQQRDSRSLVRETRKESCKERFDSLSKSRWRRRNNIFFMNMVSLARYLIRSSNMRALSSFKGPCPFFQPVMQHAPGSSSPHHPLQANMFFARPKLVRGIPNILQFQRPPPTQASCFEGTLRGPHYQGSQSGLCSVHC